MIAQIVALNQGLLQGSDYLNFGRFPVLSHPAPPILARLQC